MPVEASPDAELVNQFANTRDRRTFVPRHHPTRDGTGDEISTPAALQRWLAERGLLPDGVTVGEREHARVLELRSVLRSALDRARHGAGHRAVAETPAPFAAPLGVDISPADGPRFTSGAGVDHAVGEICAAAVRMTVTGEWWRLRVCAADDCHWVFYDQSKPGRGRYCSPDSCGNRVKTRDYRKRKAARHDHEMS